MSTSIDIISANRISTRTIFVTTQVVLDSSRKAQGFGEV
jgi:hypothetical protein